MSKGRRRRWMTALLAGAALAQTADAQQRDGARAFLAGSAA